MKVKNIWKFFLEILFPSGLLERKVGSMSLEDFVDIKNVSFDSENKVLSFFRYKNPLVREAVKQIKYKRSKKLARIFAEIIYEELLEELSEKELFENFSKPLLVPVPMSKREKRERGYNQVELLVDEIAEISGGNLKSDFSLLRKIKNTPRQTKLKREERLENVRGAFLSRSDLDGLSIILIDDVSTTGATINEARKVLERARAKVFVVVVAR